MEEQRPKVGIGLFVFKDGKVLLGKRKNAHGDGHYAGPGGHLEHLEGFAECAKREAREEAGIEIDNVQFLCVSNLQDHAPKHYIDIGLTADWVSGDPAVLEPDKCEGWSWYELDNLPKPMFMTGPNYLKAYKTGERYFDVQK